MVGGLQGEEWKFIQKYLKKRSKRFGAQMLGSTKDHFAGENEVCEISQTHKKGCEITSQQKADFAALRSWISACGVRLPTCINIGKLQEEFHNTVQNGCEIISQQKGDFATL